MTRLDLIACGPTVNHDFHRALVGILEGDENCSRLLDTLIDMSNAKMSSGSNLTCWLRLYTDACILRSLSDITRGAGAATALQSIARLDRAIVIAGATGEGRLDLILDSIVDIQKTYLQPREFNLAIPASSALVPHPCQLKTAVKGVHCIYPPPALTLFRKEYSKGPFILRKYIRDWPAMLDHPWSSTDYLRLAAGPGRIVPVEVGSDYRDEDWTQRLMNWDEFLVKMEGQASSETKPEVLYLAQHNLLMQFPALRSDIIVPDYVYADLPAPEDFPDYKPPGNIEQLVTNVWLGPGDTISPAHTVSATLNLIQSQNIDKWAH